VTGNNRRFARMQCAQQRHDKQIAVFEAQRPALPRLHLELPGELCHVVTHLAHGPGVVAKPGDGRVIGTLRAQPLRQR